MIEEKVKPKIELSKLEEFVVNTKTVNELNNLIKIYELANFEWRTGLSPIKDGLIDEIWAINEEGTCICVTNGKISYGNTDNYREISSFQQFCEMNNLTSEKLNEINNYFN